MATSRLEKIGTIFSRTSGLLRSRAMRPEDKPIWFDVYACFPPHQEPRYDRPAPKIKLRQIFYTEDVIRAKYHKQMKNLPAYNLSDTKYQTQSQAFIESYNRVKEQGALDDEKAFEAAHEMIKEKFPQKESGNVQESIGLLQSFTEAQKSMPLREPTQSINIKNIFDS